MQTFILFIYIWLNQTLGIAQTPAAVLGQHKRYPFFIQDKVIKWATLQTKLLSLLIHGDFSYHFFEHVYGNNFTQDSGRLNLSQKMKFNYYECL